MTWRILLVVQMILISILAFITKNDNYWFMSVGLVGIMAICETIASKEKE